MHRLDCRMGVVERNEVRDAPPMYARTSIAVRARAQSLRGRRIIPVHRFVAAVVAALALSTAASIVVFSILDAVLVRPSPYRDPSRLVVIWSAAIRQQGRYVWFSSPVPAPTSVVFLPLKFALGRHRSCAFC